MVLDTHKLKEALKIRVEIEALEGKLEKLLSSGSGRSAIARVGRRRSSRGRGRAKSPRGALAAAVRDVLEKAGKPLRVAGISDALKKAGFKFSEFAGGDDPKKMLSVRMYTLAGVRKVGQGLFTAA